VLSYSYNYSYKDILAIPLEDLDWIMEDAREVYDQKITFYKAFLAFMGVRK